MSSELLLVSGDSDKRVDVPTDADGIRFRDLLDSMGLLQRVRRPNYIHGHTLDLLITRKSDDIIAKEPGTERYFSDHAVVLCHLWRAKLTSTVKHVEFPKLKAIDKQKFRFSVASLQLGCCKASRRPLAPVSVILLSCLLSVVCFCLDAIKLNINWQHRYRWYNNSSDLVRLAYSLDAVKLPIDWQHRYQWS